MAIVQTIETLPDGRDFRVTVSDAGFMIENEAGELYAEAWDLPTVSHTYSETNVPVDDGEDDEEAELVEAARIMLGVSYDVENPD